MSNSPNSDLVTDFPQAGGQILSSQITTSSGRVVSKVMGGAQGIIQVQVFGPAFLADTSDDKGYGSSKLKPSPFWKVPQLQPRHVPPPLEPSELQVPVPAAGFSDRTAVRWLAFFGIGRAQMGPKPGLGCL